ncbi:MAG: phosphoribosylanthranilate isomerase, partial [Anaerolineales bacterium]|nr:phosphoribosylanthranilate isomerase [Anaerolineales bacterium]
RNSHSNIINFPTFQPSNLPNLPTFQPSNLPTFQPSSLPLLLLDAYHPNLYGGTGHVADWGMAASIARRYPIMLAGSLTPENVAEAIRVVQPWGVDVSSGVERQKGKKDHEKVRALMAAVRNVNAVQGAEKAAYSYEHSA